MKLWLATTLASLAVASSAAAAGVRAELDRDETTRDQGIVLTVVVEGSGASEPTLPPLPDFDVQGRGQSTQVQIVNGRMSSTVSFTYVLLPKRVGTLAIPPVQARIGGQVFQSRPLAVRVVEGTVAKAGNDRALFVTVDVSDDEPYVGEQILYTYRFYRKVQVPKYAQELPSFDGFLAQQLGERKDYSTTLEGQTYVVSEVKIALFPLEAKTVELPGLKISAEVAVQARGRGGDPFTSFDDFFGRGQTETRVVRSDPVTITVRPLPAPPPGFAGVVGRYSLSATLSKNRLAVGESATLTVVVQGEGDVRNLPEPKLPPVAGIKAYGDAPEVKLELRGDKLGGTATYSQAIVATEAGELALPGLTLVYFDPDAATYAEARSPELRVLVEAGGKEELNAAGALAESKEQVQLLGDDILPMHVMTQGLWGRRGRLGLRGLTLVGLFVPPLAFALTLSWQRRRERRARDQDAERRRTALSRAGKCLDKAEQALTRSQLEDAIALASRAVREFLGDKLGLSGLALTADEARARLAERGASAPLVQRVYDEARRLEAAQYGGAAALAGGNLTGKLQELRGMLKELDRQL